MTAYFSFGQGHFHWINGKRFDCDCLVEITDDNPRDVMFKTFGDKWSMQYDKERMQEALHHYPRGVIPLEANPATPTPAASE